jgi:transaldolase
VLSPGVAQVFSCWPGGRHDRVMHIDTPLQRLSRLGQSVWIDGVSRELLQSGGLRRLIAEYAVVGVVTDPMLLERAIAVERAYERQIRGLRTFGYQPAEALGEIAATDVTNAAVELLPVWQATGGADGYVSWQVDPALAWDAGATLSEVRRLARRIDLPNLLVGIPATEPGLVAIENSIAAGYGINVTPIVSLERYAAVAEAYLRGLRRAGDAGLDLSRIHSVASVPVSQLDTAVDRLLESHGSSAALALRGRAGIATAKVVYRHYQEVFSGPRWEALSAHGAVPQRPLWATTRVRGAAYPSVRYVEELIGARTLTTLSTATLSAFEDHGRVDESLARGVEDAGNALRELADVGVRLEGLTAQLERAAVADLAQSLDAAVHHIDARGQAAQAA